YRFHAVELQAVDLDRSLVLAGRDAHCEKEKGVAAESAHGWARLKHNPCNASVGTSGSVGQQGGHGGVTRPARPINMTGLVVCNRGLRGRDGEHDAETDGDQQADGEPDAADAM